MLQRNSKTFCVYDINLYIKNMIAMDYALSHVYVKGEVSNCKYHTSGHIYFTLKDSKSQIACVMFSSQTSNLRFRLNEGQSVIVFGNIGVYERDGKYQLYASEIFLDGAGALYEQYEQLKRELEEEGLFSTLYKKAIPFFARRVGIVTSKTGAAIHDMITIANRRNPYVQLLLYPAKVQGEGAARTIISGIHTLDQFGVDVIIVGRGGGSIEDLWAFNEEIVARAIFECHTPIISAVGHETDFTIADYVADLRAPTPSAAAELAICSIRDVIYTLEDKKLAMQHIMNRRVEKRRKELENISLKLEMNSPNGQIQQKRQFLLTMEQQIQNNMERLLTQQKHQLALYIERLKGLSPLDKLNHGFSYVTNEENQVIKEIKQVKKGQLIKISVTDGDIWANIEKTKLRRNNNG